MVVFTKNGNKIYDTQKRKPLAKNTKDQVRRMIKSAIAQTEEVKYFDEYGSNSVSTLGNIIRIATITQGDLNNQRIGDIIKLKKLELKYNVAGQAATATYASVRVMLVQWYPLDYDISTSLGEPPTFAELLKSVAGVSAPISPINPEFKDEFKVLYDKTHTIHSLDQGSSVANARVTVKKFGHNKIDFYDGGTYGNGQLYLVLISDDGLVPYPSVNWATMLYYTDS